MAEAGLKPGQPSEELQRLSEGCVYGPGGPLWGAVGRSFPLKDRRLAFCRAAPPLGREDFPTSELTLCPSYFPSPSGDFQFPFGLHLPACLLSLPSGPKAGFSSKSLGSGRPGPAASGEVLPARPAQPEELELLCDLSRDVPTPASR